MRFRGVSVPREGRLQGLGSLEQHGTKTHMDTADPHLRGPTETTPMVSRGEGETAGLSTVQKRKRQPLP